MDLRDAMREASDAPPPTTIDVDRIITGERRRTHGLRVASFAAVVTVLAFGATMLPRYFGESLAPPVVGAPPSAPPSRSGPALAPCEITSGSGDPPLHPVTEPCEEATTRLAAGFGGNFQEELGNAPVDVEQHQAAHFFVHAPQPAG